MNDKTIISKKLNINLNHISFSKCKFDLEGKLLEWNYPNIDVPEDLTIWKNELENLEFLNIKKNKLKQLKKLLIKQKHYGVCDSGLGFNVDNRRNGIENDVSNVQALIAMGNTTYYIDADNIKHDNITIENLQTMLTNMLADGLNKYTIYHTTKYSIIACNTQEELNAIDINNINWSLS